jgi:hypothetical protein
MKRKAQLVVLLFLFTMPASRSEAKPRAPSYDPVPQTRHAVRANSFLEFTLRRLNSDNKDYGKWLSEERTALFNETVSNGYFWSNVVALALLACFFIIIVYQQRVLGRREWSTAETLTQFEQSLTGSEAQLKLAFRKNRELAQKLAVAQEATSRALTLPVTYADHPAQPSPKPRSNPTAATPSATPTPASPTPENKRPLPTAASPVQLANQMRLFSSDADLIMKVNSLEQQLAHSQRDNHALRRRIANGGDRQAREKQSQAKEA